MNLVYTYSESTVKPAEVQIVKSTVYLRKDIVAEERTKGDGNTTTFWTYQEAKMTVEDFNKYYSLMTAMNAIKVENDQLTIMEAIADLYDMIANMK